MNEDKIKIFWIDPEVENGKIKAYTEKLKEKHGLHIKTFNNVDEALNYMEGIEFLETRIIIDKLFKDFIKAFNDNIKKMNFAPKIIVFTKNKEKFLRDNKEYEESNNVFFTFGGIKTSFEEIEEFVTKENFYLKKEKIEEEVRFTFDYIDNNEQLVLPIFFKALIDRAPDKHNEDFIDFLYDTYSKKDRDENKNANKTLLDLLATIKSMKGIPLEILTKHFARIYSIESDFYNDINKDLSNNIIEKYLPFIKALYEGVKLELLPLGSSNDLYRGSKMTNDEMEKINEFLENNKNNGMTIVFSKCFLSFSQNRYTAEKYYKKGNDKQNLFRVLFVLKRDDNIGYNLATHGDISKFSVYPKENEVLFFPFSSFKIESKKEIILDNKKGYEIHLSYLGKYIDNILNQENIIQNANKLPESNFKNQLEGFGLIEPEKIENISINAVHKEFKNYELEIQKIEIKNNNIIGEIEINSEDINKNISIINSFENAQRNYGFGYEREYKNEKEIKESVKIKINGKNIDDFSYVHIFDKIGKYKIEYLFKKQLKKTNHLFYKCVNIVSLNLMNFNTTNVTKMNFMFHCCKSLKKLNLSNINTKKVTNIKYMFGGCSKLESINLKKFNTQNVEDMSHLFWDCKSLKNVDLSEFNTQNAINMSNMFNGCKLLTNLYLSSLSTKNATDISGMFVNCKNLVNLSLSNFNTKKVENMSCMFMGCENIKSLDLSKFETKNLIDMSNMFFGCYSLINLDLSNFETFNVNNMNGIFDGCNCLTKNGIKTSNKQILKILKLKQY